MRRFVKQIRDGNHGEIVKHLSERGIEVIETFRPLDVLVFHNERSGWLEIKTEKRNSAIQTTQIKFMANTRMPVAFAKTVDEAMEFVRTFNGLTQSQKDNLAIFLQTANKTQYHPAVVERVLGWKEPGIN